MGAIIKSKGRSGTVLFFSQVGEQEASPSSALGASYTAPSSSAAATAPSSKCLIC